MKKSIIMPIILALGVGMSFAAKQRIQIDTVITVSDGTLYSASPTKGTTSTSITGGDVTYTQARCVDGVCSELAESTSKFLTPTYSWEKWDINSGEWVAYKDTVFNDNGEYRLRVDYKHVYATETFNKGFDIAVQLAYSRYGCGLTNKKNIFDTVKVNATLFSDLGLCRDNYTRISIDGGKNWTYTFFAIRSFVSPTITVGKSNPIVFKPLCTDGSDKCSAKYTGPSKSFSGDTIEFSAKGTSDDYGWGMTPVEFCIANGIGRDTCENISGDTLAELYSMLFSQMFEGKSLRVSGNDSATSLYGLRLPIIRLGLAFLSWLFGFDISDLPDYSDLDIDEIPYRYVDTSNVADTIYFPMSYRDIDINYKNYENGSYKDYEYGNVIGPKKAHDGEVLFLTVVPEDGYDVDTIFARGYDEHQEIQTNILPPSFSEMREDGSKIAIFMAQKGFEQNISAKFKKVGQEVSMLKPTNGTYSVISRTKEHKVGEKSFITNAAGANISVKPTPDAGYAVRSVTCSYFTKEDGEVTNDLMLGKDSLFSCAIPDTSELSEDILNRTKQITITVNFAKESKINIDVTGRGTVTAYIKGSVDTAGTYTKGYCSSDPTETAGNACTALDGDTILIEVNDSEGHPLQQLSCKDGTTTTNCKDSKKFVMKAADAQIVAIFDAVNYALTKTGDHADDFDLYVGWDSKKPATQAHEFDTVYVRSKDGKHVVVPGNEGSKFSVVDPNTGVNVIYFIMPASNKEVHVDDNAYYSTVNLARKIVGKGTPVFSVAYGSSRALEEKDLVRVRNGYDYFAFLKSTPAEGYTFDSTRCFYGDSYSDSTAISLLKEGRYADSFLAEKEEDVTCEIFFNPRTYKISWTQADTNGFVQGVPEKGKTDESISFKVSPVVDYEIDFVKAYYTEKDSSNKDVSVLLKLSNTYDQKKNTYTYNFSMPAHDVNVEVAFKEIKSSSSSAKSSSSKAKSSSSSAKAKSSSSSVKAKSSSSSAKAKSSSSSAKAKSSSSSAKAKSSSSKKKTALPAMAQVPQFSLLVNGRTMQIAGARVGSKMEVFDLQGHRVLSGSVDAANFSVAMPRSGSYLVRIDGQTQNVNIK